MKKKYKVIIDMDIGDDIDDAFALLLAMKMKLDIIGITTVFRNTSERARIAKKLLKLYGNGYESVPVFAGYGKPYVNVADISSHLCQYTPDIEKNEYAPDSENADDAINFIIESCNEYKEDLRIIAIGPFTNIAKVIEKDGSALENINGLYIMAGAFFKHYVDWNVHCDPEAAKIMFDSLNGIKCYGADVTHQLTISASDDKCILGYNKDNPAVKYVSELYALWKGGDEDKLAKLHDPLVIACTENPELCGMVTSPVAVITEGLARGLTLNVEGYKKYSSNPAYKDFDLSKRQRIAQTVDRKKVIELFMKCFK